MIAPSRRACSIIAVSLTAVLPLRLMASPTAIVEECAAGVPAEISGIKGLDAACPGLEHAIQALGLDRLLYDGWSEQLDRHSLQDVSRLVELYGGRKPDAGPDRAALPGILKSMAGEQAPAPKSWWDAFKAWLKSWLQGHDPDSLSWLDRWLDRMRQTATLVNAILYSLIGLVVVVASWVVFNELRAAGLVTRRRAPRVSGRSESVATTSSAVNPGSEPVALTERIAALLRLLVRRLMQTGRLTSERSLTHRELAVRGAFDSDAQRAVFAAVASSAESILYGAHGVPAEHLDRVLRDGEALLAQLPDGASPP